MSVQYKLPAASCQLPAPSSQLTASALGTTEFHVLVQLTIGLRARHDARRTIRAYC
jgi:hypothetical protein